MNPHQRYCSEQLGKVRQYLLVKSVNVKVSDVLTAAAIERYRTFLVAQDFGNARQTLDAQKEYDALVGSQLRRLGVPIDTPFLHQLEDSTHYFIYLEDLVMEPVPEPAPRPVSAPNWRYI